MRVEGAHTNLVSLLSRFHADPMMELRAGRGALVKPPPVVRLRRLHVRRGVLGEEEYVQVGDEDDEAQEADAQRDQPGLMRGPTQMA